VVVVKAPARAATLTASWLVFWIASLGWFVQQLLLFWLLPASCNGRPWLAPALGWGATLLVAIAAALGWRRWRRGPHAPDPPRIHGRSALVEQFGSIAPWFFLSAMLWQSAATLIYPPCLH
jgi:hypothetical protein